MYNKLINSAVVLNTLFNLRERWKDEKDYEDFNEYTNVMKKVVSNTIGEVTNAVGTKRPFGIKFNHNGKNCHLFLKTKGYDAWLALKVS